MEKYYKIKNGLEIPSQDTLQVTESTRPSVRPSLLLDFQNSKTVDERISFSRPSTGTYFDENGVLQTAGNNEPRFDHDPVTGASKGLLRENQATNLMTYSEQFDNAAWVKSGVLITANAIIAPDGILSMDAVGVGGGNAPRQLTSSATVVSGSVYTFSCFAKAGSLLDISLQFVDASVWSGGSLTVRFNLNEKTSEIVSGTPFGYSISEVANGIFRVSVSSTCILSGSASFRIRLSSNSGEYTLSGATAAGIYIWGAQLEEGEYPTSYIKTEASQVTRAADVAVLTNTDAYNTTEFTAVSQPFGVSSVSAQTAELNGDVPIERLYVYPRNLPQDQINTLVENDGWWSWRIIGSSFALPNFTTDGTVEVDWGDGTVETLTTAEHTFTNASPHTVRFRLTSGTYFRPIVSNNATHKNKVVALGSAPSNMLIDTYRAFWGCSSLKSVDATFVGRPAIDHNLSWANCTSLTAFPLIDTSSGTIFNSTWSGCTALQSFPLLDMSSATNVGGAWSDCSSLTEFPAIDFPLSTAFNTSWRNCTSLTSFPAIDTSAGTNFSDTWINCNSLTSFPLLDMSLAENLNECWDGCSSLTSFPSIDFPVCTNFTAAWYNCNSLTSFPLIDTSSGTSFGFAWYNCNSLTSFPLIDTSSGTNFGEAWRGCSSLTSFPLIDTSSGTDFYRAWRDCTSLTSFPLIDTSSGTNFGEAWRGCSSLTSFPLIATSSGTNFYAAWYVCSSLTSFPLIDTSSGTNFGYAWYNCTSLTSFPLIDTSSGTDFAYAWYNCNSLTSFPLIDTSSGTDFYRAWDGCSSLTSFPLIDTSSGTNFGEAWDGCYSLTLFPLLNVNLSTSFIAAWRNCSSMTDFPANFFDSWTGTPVGNCFLVAWDGCTSLTPTSVVNILTSLDTSGQSAPASGVDITIDYAGGDISAADTAIANLYARGWTVTINGTLVDPYLLLSYSGAAAAYSLRDLNNTDPNTVRVRRSSDNTEQDFTASEIIDGTLVSFCGAGDGFVTTWYDQSGNDNHATQSGASAQPKIVDGGVLVTENGKAAMSYNDDYLRSSSYLLPADENILAVSVVRVDSGDNLNPRLLAINNSSAGVNAQFGYNGDERYYIRSDSATIATNDTFADVLGNQYLLSFGISGGTDYFARNGDLKSFTLTGQSPTGNSSLGDGIHILKGYTLSDHYFETGTIQELIIYPSDQSVNRAGIETNINNYYGIY